MKEIGGYFSFSFKSNGHIHQNSIALNTARNCFEYILRAKGIKKVYIPYYTCEVMLEPLHKLNIGYLYYYIDSSLNPILKGVNKNDAILYTNYFGIKNETVIKLSSEYSNLIIDNSQAFFSVPINNIDTFYSARKFFGVPDGAFLYTNKFIDDVIERDYSYDKISHLAKSIELGTNASYEDFLTNDYKLYNQPIRLMSEFTNQIIGQQDFDNSKTIRERNFLYLHRCLEGLNEYKISVESLCGPMFYPFLFKNDSFKKNLISKNIYVPTLWKNVYQTTATGSVERYFADYLCALPVDQRYNLNDMDYIIQTISEISGTKILQKK